MPDTLRALAMRLQEALDAQQKATPNENHFSVRVKVALNALRDYLAQPETPPTWADEPPWSGWFSCEDCNGWFNETPVAYDSGAEVCGSCAKKRDRVKRHPKEHDMNAPENAHIAEAARAVAQPEREPKFQTFSPCQACGASGVALAAPRAGEREPSAEAVDEFLRLYFPPSVLEAVKTDIMDSELGITRYNGIRAAVQIGLAGAYAIDMDPRASAAGPDAALREAAAAVVEEVDQQGEGFVSLDVIERLRAALSSPRSER